MAAKIIEEIRLNAEQLVDKIQELMKESSVKQIRIRSKSGSVLLVLPVNVGVLAAGLALVAHPILSTVAALTMYYTEFKVEVERMKPPKTDDAEVDAEIVDIKDEE